MFDTVQSVTAVTQYISDLFTIDEVLSDVWVKGEVSNMKRAASGHWYFTLKDSDASLRCVMWRSSAERQQTTPQDGDALEVHGKVGIYAPRGEYQLYADIIRPVGAGDLYRQFELLKAKLQAEGLFDQERKRPFPTPPAKIGVVTSPNAAAFQDVLNVLQRRFPLVEVVLSPTMVQGESAPPQIVDALELVNDYTNCDVILLVRGGGSIEDLWAFNDERVARAVAVSRIPVVAGVGHETDFTIVDFVADERAPTPSAAAELVTPDMRDMRDALLRQMEKLEGLTTEVILDRRDALERLQRTMTYISPAKSIDTLRQRIDDFNARMTRTQHTQLERLSERLDAKRAALEAASPQAILERGYAIVTRRVDRKRISTVMDVNDGDAYTVQFKDGTIRVRVDDENTPKRKPLNEDEDNDHEQYQRPLF